MYCPPSFSSLHTETLISVFHWPFLTNSTQKSSYCWSCRLTKLLRLQRNGSFSSIAGPGLSHCALAVALQGFSLALKLLEQFFASPLLRRELNLHAEELGGRVKDGGDESKRLLTP